MSTVTAAFDEFDDSLKLDPDERQAAQDCHHEIREVLRRAGLATGAFLQGSLARKTMLGPLRDIDMVVLLSATLRYLRDKPGGATEAMRLLQGALAKAYPKATFNLAKHALQIDFGDGGFSFDVVPAFELEDGTDDVEIADTEQDCWERSNPRELVRAVAARNQQCDGRFVHQVRMTKQFVRVQLDGKVCGLISESVAYAAITTRMPHPLACETIFGAYARMIGGPIFEPTGRDDLAGKISSDLVEPARRQFADAAERAAEARRLAEAGDYQAAIAIWHDLFGKEFPVPSLVAPRVAATAWAGGSVTSAGTISAAPLGRRPARPTRSWRS